ncbi:unnamed protein product [Polarella glacialis]|uniref:Sulfhydryl oxidase n=1 Tax=Polarella glacialis TaxID=89957 RepID=A0A813E8W1_POLGL|nr:unnamed protein product [Polarella glacialis]
MGSSFSSKQPGQSSQAQGQGCTPDEPPCLACDISQSSNSSSNSSPNSSKSSGLRPPSRAEIGRAAWRYVHTMAAEYPEEPKPREQASGLFWLRSFVKLYPCHLCSQEFIEVCSDLPPRLGSRADYAMWWCEAHNRVRNDLSQSLQRCELGKLLDFGREGRMLDEAKQAICATSSP